jgi:hypothetical protein
MEQCRNNRTEWSARVFGQTVTFAPSTTPLTLQAGQPYTIAFYAIPCNLSGGCDQDLRVKRQYSGGRKTP